MSKIKKMAAAVSAALAALLPNSGNDAAGLVEAAQKSDVTGNYAAMERWRVASKDEVGTLIFSDSPEYVKEEGILYRDTVMGKARILFYHLNDSATDKRVAVLLERESDYPATVTITRGGSGKPGQDFLLVGRTTQRAYFTDERRETLTVEQGKAVLLQKDMAKKILRPGDLVYGVYDFETNRPVKVTVLMHDVAVTAEQFAKNAKVLPKDEYALRGTFKGMNRVLSAVKSYDGERDGLVYVPIGDNKIDKYRDGTDSIDGKATNDFGNYGILYKIKLPLAENKSARLFLIPTGGVYAGAVNVYAHGENSEAKTVMTPRYGKFFGHKEWPTEVHDYLLANRTDDRNFLSKYHEVTSLGTYRGRDLLIEYSPPGGSNLPVLLVIAPG